MIGTAKEFLAATENLGPEDRTHLFRYLRLLTERNMKSDAQLRCNIDLIRFNLWQLHHHIPLSLTRY